MIIKLKYHPNIEQIIVDFLTEKTNKYFDCCTIDGLDFEDFGAVYDEYLNQLLTIFYNVTDATDEGEVERIYITKIYNFLNNKYLKITDTTTFDDVENFMQNIINEYK